MTASRELSTIDPIDVERHASLASAASGTTKAATSAARTATAPGQRQDAKASATEPRTGRLVVISRLPRTTAAEPATRTDTRSNGSDSAAARPKSYRDANAVKTSVVNTRTRSKPGTENSEMVSTKMTSAAAVTFGNTNGQVIWRSTRAGVVTSNAASSSRGSTRRNPTSVASIDSG
jgi:hypothetical protein